MTAPDSPADTRTSFETGHRPPSRMARRLLLVILLLFAIGFLLYQSGTFTPRPKIALVTANQGPFWDMVVHGAQDAAERQKVKLTVIRSDGNEDKQTAALKAIAGHHFDGVAVSPNNGQAQAGVLADIGSESPLITYDSDVGISNRLCFIGTDNYDAGRTAAQYLKQA